MMIMMMMRMMIALITNVLCGLRWNGENEHLSSCQKSGAAALSDLPSIHVNQISPTYFFLFIKSSKGMTR